MFNVKGRYCVILALLAFLIPSAATAEEVNIALGQSTSGSSPGWGGGSYPQEIVDGLRTYNYWAHGLAFTGGDYNPSMCGERQAVVNFDGPMNFNKVIIWHHGQEHIPLNCQLSYWDGSDWVSIDFQRDVDLSYEPPTGYSVTPDQLTFSTVTGSKVRYSFDNCDLNILSQPNVHGWIYEFEVYEPSDLNNPPAAADDAYTTAEDSDLIIPAPGVLGNDTDADGDSLSISSITNPSNGAAVINPDGSLNYMPNENYYGSDSFTYTVSDGKGGTDSASVTITIGPVNDAPSAASDYYEAIEDDAIIVVEPGILGNDEDIDGDDLTVTGFTQPAYGQATADLIGSMSYNPIENYCGEDGFTYTVSDEEGLTDIANVVIDVECVNDGPDAVDDQATTDKDTPVDLEVLMNDGDIDGDELVVDSVSDPEHGRATDNGDGTIDYMPDPNYWGVDSFTYTIVDEGGLFDTARVNITVNDFEDNTCPVAWDDEYYVISGKLLVVDVTEGILQNDDDIDGDNLTSKLSTEPSHGTLTMDDDGSFSYKPAKGFVGTDSFTYKAFDGECYSDPATVMVFVAKCPWFIKNELFTATCGVEKVVPASEGILANDPTAVAVVNPEAITIDPKYGTVEVFEDGSFVYNVAPNIPPGTYVQFKYWATNGVCDATYQGIAKIQVTCSCE